MKMFFIIAIIFYNAFFASELALCVSCVNKNTLSATALALHPMPFIGEPYTYVNYGGMGYIPEYKPKTYGYYDLGISLSRNINKCTTIGLGTSLGKEYLAGDIELTTVNIYSFFNKYCPQYYLFIFNHQNGTGVYPFYEFNAKYYNLTVKEKTDTIKYNWDGEISGKIGLKALINKYLTISIGGTYNIMPNVISLYDKPNVMRKGIQVEGKIGVNVINF